MYGKNSIPQVFEPVLREVSAFSHLFNKIYWLGYDQGKNPPLNSHFIESPSIKVTLLPPSGGKNILSKVRIIFLLPLYLFYIGKTIVHSDIIHTRGPSIPALLALLISLFFPRKKFWHKYAGSWENTPYAFSYKLNRKLLQFNLPGIVFVSQKSPTDPHRIVQVPNPSFTLNEMKENIKSGELKQFDGEISICYVGRYDSAKGVNSFINAIQMFSKNDYIDTFHFAGFNREQVQNKISTSNLKMNLEIHGVLNRNALNRLYRECHFIILPSETEGFPKVIIEAASFGCIPIIPKISSILHHFNATQGRAIELEDNSVASIYNTLKNLDNNKQEYNKISQKVMEYSHHFTYEAYNQNIEKYILHSCE